jgi:hypothetical protein
VRPTALRVPGPSLAAAALAARASESVRASESECRQSSGSLPGPAWARARCVHAPTALATIRRSGPGGPGWGPEYLQAAASESGSARRRYLDLVFGPGAAAARYPV